MKFYIYIRAELDNKILTTIITMASTKRYKDLCALIASSAESTWDDDDVQDGYWQDGKWYRGGKHWLIGNNNNEIYHMALEGLGKYPYDRKTNSNVAMVIEDLVNEVIMEDLKKIVKPKKPKKITFKIIN